MKILFIVDEFPSLSETFILNQITGLLDQEVDIDIFSLRLNKQKKIHEDVKKYNLLSRTIYIDVPKQKLKRIFKTLFLFLINFLKYPWKLVRIINFTKYHKYGIKTLSLTYLYIGLFFLKNKKQYDIIYAHFGPSGLLAAQLRAMGVFNAPVITSFHGHDISALLDKKGKAYYDFLFKKGDLFMPISKYWKKRLLSLGCPADKVIVHHMGVNIKKFKFKTRLSRKPLRIVSVCRLVEKKGIRYALEALQNLRKNYPDISFRYTIVGNGPLETQLKNLTRKFSLQEYVNFKGWLNQEEILKILERNDIFLAPSCKSKDGDMEGIPVSIMEAMAKGLIVIATKHSGIPELVIDGKSGLLVPEKNSIKIMKSVKFLAQGEKKWPRYSNNARKTIERSFNINLLNKNLLKIFNDVLNKKTVSYG